MTVRRRKHAKKTPTPWIAEAKKFRKTLDKLDLTTASQRTATLLGLSIRQCQRIVAGEQPVPTPVELLLQMYLKHGLPDE